VAAADSFIANSQAPSFGLHLTSTANGMAYRVMRDHECLFTGARRDVSVWLRGYGAALAHPELAALNDAINDEEAGNGRVLDCAIAVANLPPGGAS
jgi:hypothetical protein